MEKVLGKKTEFFFELHVWGDVFSKISRFIPEILCSSTLWVYATYISGKHFLRSVQQCKWYKLVLSMKRVRGSKQHYFGNCTHGGMFLSKRSFIPEILCSSTLLVYATYISGQHFLSPLQQSKQNQLILSMKRVRDDKQHYSGNCTHGGMFLKKKVASKYSVPRHFWYMLHTFLVSIF